MAQRMSWRYDASAGNLCPMAEDEDGHKKYVVGNVPYDPETTLVYVQVVIEPDGGGGVSASFFQDRRPPPGSREANAARDHTENAALLRQAAEMVLEHAENMLRRPPGRPPGEGGDGGVREPRTPIEPKGGSGEAVAMPGSEARAT
jgi:hypothetical protein